MDAAIHPCFRPIQDAGVDGVHRDAADHLQDVHDRHVVDRIRKQTSETCALRSCTKTYPWSASRLTAKKITGTRLCRNV
jgi:hypothetical protein